MIFGLFILHRILSYYTWIGIIFLLFPGGQATYLYSRNFDYYYLAYEVSNIHTKAVPQLSEMNEKIFCPVPSRVKIEPKLSAV